MNAFPTGLGVGVSHYIDPDPVGAGTLSALGDPWWYNWGGSYWPGRPGTENYWPMVYGPVANKKIQAYKDAVGRTSHAWFLLNEPNRGDQADMTAAEGKTLIDTCVDDWGMTRWCGPNVCIDGVSGGYNWLNQYMAIPGRKIPEAWGIHFYNNGTWQDFKARFETFETWMATNNVVRQVIVTETNAGYLDDETMPDNIAFMQGVKTYMASKPRLQAIGWYASQHYLGSQEHACDLMRWGEITELGKAFKDIER